MPVHAMGLLRVLCRSAIAVFQSILPNRHNAQVVRVYARSILAFVIDNGTNGDILAGKSDSRSMGELMRRHLENRPYPSRVFWAIHSQQPLPFTAILAVNASL